jgi:hypothetical protein
MHKRLIELLVTAGCTQPIAETVLNYLGEPGHADGLQALLKDTAQYAPGQAGKFFQIAGCDGATAGRVAEYFIVPENRNRLVAMIAEAQNTIWARKTHGAGGAAE